jgi:hypothetical protein
LQLGRWLLDQPARHDHRNTPAPTSCIPESAMTRQPSSLGCKYLVPYVHTAGWKTIQQAQAVIRGKKPIQPRVQRHRDQLAHVRLQRLTGPSETDDWMPLSQVSGLTGLELSLRRNEPHTLTHGGKFNVGWAGWMRKCLSIRSHRPSPHMRPHACALMPSLSQSCNNTDSTSTCAEARSKTL